MQEKLDIDILLRKKGKKVVTLASFATNLLSDPGQAFELILPISLVDKVLTVKTDWKGCGLFQVHIWSVLPSPFS